MALKNFLSGLLTNEETDDQTFEDEVETEENDHKKPKANEAKSEEKSMALNENKTNNSNNTRTTAGSNAIELKVVRPESWEAALQIGHYLLNNCTVVLNLEATSKETARRIVDFLNGVAFAIEGEVKSVTNSTCIITPKNVSVSGEVMSEKQEQAQSNSRDSFDNF
jgi:cell division inhibitor SepF